MAKRYSAARGAGSALGALVIFLAWLTGIIVALAVGFGMISGTLPVPNIPEFITVSAGWIVVVLVILGAILAIVEKISR